MGFLFPNLVWTAIAEDPEVEIAVRIAADQHEPYSEAVHLWEGQMAPLSEEESFLTCMSARLGKIEQTCCPPDGSSWDDYFSSIDALNSSIAAILSDTSTRLNELFLARLKDHARSLQEQAKSQREALAKLRYERTLNPAHDADLQESESPWARKKGNVLSRTMRSRESELESNIRDTENKAKQLTQAIDSSTFSLEVFLRWLARPVVERRSPDVFSWSRHGGIASQEDDASPILIGYECLLGFLSDRDMKALRDRRAQHDEQSHSAVVWALIGTPSGARNYCPLSAGEVESLQSLRVREKESIRVLVPQDAFSDPTLKKKWGDAKRYLGPLCDEEWTKHQNRSLPFQPDPKKSLIDDVEHNRRFVGLLREAQEKVTEDLVGIQTSRDSLRRRLSSLLKKDLTIEEQGNLLDKIRNGVESNAAEYVACGGVLSPRAFRGLTQLEKRALRDERKKLFNDISSAVRAWEDLQYDDYDDEPDPSEEDDGY